MTPETFTQRFCEKISRGLPGEKAHLRLVPMGRLLQIDQPSPAKSAVMLLVDFVNGEPHLTFIRRTVYDGVHSGQVAFPGGKCDKAKDSSPIDTAIRETMEEIGFLVDRSRVITTLSQLYIPVSGLVVYPCVAVVNQTVFGKINHREVAEVFKAPLEAFAFNNIRTGIFKGKDYAIEAPYWQVNEHRIWGATAMILSEFVELAV